MALSDWIGFSFDVLKSFLLILLFTRSVHFLASDVYIVSNKN